MRKISFLATLGFMAAFSSPVLSENLKIGYINKMGDHPWFVAEVDGARKKAQELGADFVVQDVQFDANLAITTIDTMIGDGVAGLALVIPEKGLGPTVAAKITAAGIPFIAVDDDFTFADGTPVPYVGMNAKNIGTRVGEELAKIYHQEGWADKKMKLVSIEDRKIDTCMQRNSGAEEAFLAHVPGFKRDDILRVAYDNTMVNAIDVMTTTLTAYPDVTNWAFYSCNDDGVLGAARALENSGYAATAGLGIGIDGSRACDAFGSGVPSGFRGTMWLNSANHGSIAVELLVKAAREGADIPLITYTDPEFITADNFATSYKAKLCQ